MIKLEYHHLSIPNQLIYLGIRHQRLLTSHKEIDHMPPNEEYITPMDLPKVWNLSLIKSLDLADNLQEIEGDRRNAELYYECTISKTQTVGIFTGQMSWALQPINCREKIWIERESLK